MKAGLQTNVYVESLLIEKQKLGYNDMSNDRSAEAAVRCVTDILIALIPLISLVFLIPLICINYLYFLLIFVLIFVFIYLFHN